MKNQEVKEIIQNAKNMIDVDCFEFAQHMINMTQDLDAKAITTNVRAELNSDNPINEVLDELEFKPANSDGKFKYESLKG